MGNINRFEVMGNVTRDPEIKYTPKGTAVCQIGVAVNRYWKDASGEKQEEVTFLDVELWGRQAEIAGEYLKKGDQTFVEGRMKLESWDDKKSGEKRYKLKLIGENLQLIGGGKRSGSSEEPDSRERKQAQRPPPAKRPPADPDLDAPEDDIPF